MLERRRERRRERERERDLFEAEIHSDMYIYALYIHVFDTHMCVICT